MFKRILSLFKTQPEPADNVAVSTRSLKKSAPAALRRSRSRRKGIDSEWLSSIEEPGTAERLNLLPNGYRHLNDLLVPNHKSRSGYSQVDHVVIGPRCVFVIETRSMTTGEIRGGRRDANWTVSTSKVKMYNPLMQHRGHVQAIQAHLGDYAGMRIVSVVTFTNRCRISVDPDVRYMQSDELVVYDHELVETIVRKTEKLEADPTGKGYSEQDIQTIHELLCAANATNSDIRAEHMEKAKGIK